MIKSFSNFLFYFFFFFKKKRTLDLDYKSNEWAWIVKNTMDVDEELKPDVISRTTEVHGNFLKM